MEVRRFVPRLLGFSPFQSTYDPEQNTRVKVAFLVDKMVYSQISLVFGEKKMKNSIQC